MRLPSTVRAFFDPSDQMYVVDFEQSVTADASGATPPARTAAPWHWEMFTHGVCTDADASDRLQWSRVGITARHLSSDRPEREDLGGDSTKPPRDS